MPTKPEGVYPDGRGGWYLKVNIGRDPISGRREQLTRRGSLPQPRPAGLVGSCSGRLTAVSSSRSLRMLIDELLDLYLDGLDADGRLSEKTRFDYRHSADDYVDPTWGRRRARRHARGDPGLAEEAHQGWRNQAQGRRGGKQKPGKGLSPNTVRLARAPLSGRSARDEIGLVASNPIAQVPRPRPKRSIPKHWTPEQAREFLGLMETDRTWPIGAFLLGRGSASANWCGCAGQMLTSDMGGYEWWTSLPHSVTISFRRWERAMMRSARLSSTADSAMSFGDNRNSRRKRR